jgi:hypothetical protein
MSEIIIRWPYYNRDRIFYLILLHANVYFIYYSILHYSIYCITKVRIFNLYRVLDSTQYSFKLLVENEEC